LLLTLFTDSGILIFNVGRIYKKNENVDPNEVVTAVATYQTGKYNTGDPVYMRFEIISFPVVKISIAY
jgi:phage tail sheath gpL-like